MNRRRGITVLDIAALTLATIGAINWGLSAANFNLVRRLFGRGTFLERSVYALVGLAGIDLAWLTARFISSGGYQMGMPRRSRIMQQVGEQAQQIGRSVQQAGKEVQQGSYQQPGMRP